MLLLFVAPLLATMMAAHAARHGHGHGGCSDAGLRGQSWVRNGDHAKEILQNWINHTPGWLTVDDFGNMKADWILHHGNPSGFYLWVNLHCNYNAMIECYENHMKPSIDFDGA